MYYRFISFVICICIPITTTQLLKGEDRSTGKSEVEIVFLNQFLTHIPWIEEFWAEYRQQLRKEFGSNTSFISEPIDIERIHDQEYVDAFVSYLSHKYSDRDITLFLVYKKLAEYLDLFREQSIGDIPVLFMNLHEEDQKQVRILDHDKLILLHVTFKPTIELALTLLPETKNIYVVSGTSIDDLYCIEAIRRDGSELGIEDKIHYLIGEGVEATYKKISGLPDDSIVLYTSYIRDPSNNLFDPVVFLRGLVEHSNAPIFSNYTPHLGVGVVGGCMSSPVDGAKQAVDLSLEAINYPDVKFDKVYLEHKIRIDFKQVEKWSISESNIPEEALIIHKKPAVWVEYREQVLFAIIVVFSLLLVIILLIHFFYKSKKAEQSFRYTNSVLKSIRDVGQLIAKETNITDLVNETCSILVKERGFLACSISMREDITGLTAVFGARQSEQETSRISNHLKREHFRILEEKSWGIQRRSIRCNKSEYLSLSLLLGSDDEVYGVFSIILNPTHADVENEVVLFEEVANDLSYALHMIGVEMHRQKILDEIIIEKEKAESANRAKDDFLAVVSHEMRTPLNPIVGFATLMLDDLGGTEHEFYLNQIISSSNHMVDQINDILNFSQLQKETVRRQISRFSLSRLIERILQDLTPVPGAERIVSELNFWHSKIPGENDLWIRSDEKMFYQLISNLLTNACKYSREGEVKLEVEFIEDDEVSGVLKIDVRDKGIGIPEDKIETIFKAFSQVDCSSRRAYEGVGLGLAICKKLTDLLDGKMGVDSEMGVGSHFWLHLPIEYSIQQDSKSDFESTTLNFDVFERNWNILVAEDNPNNAAFINSSLKKMGGKITVVENGLQVLEACEKNKFDLLLLDLNMPAMDGLSSGSKVRQIPGYEGVPIIALTADCTQQTMANVISAKFDDFLEKPIPHQDLVQTLKGHLEK